MKASTKKATSPQQSQTAWKIACPAILIAAGLLRLLYLSDKALHHDEGVNGLFLAPLFRGGFYHYDPANYHGPTLYYFGLLTTTLNAFFYGKYGLSTFAIRLVPALFGIGLVWLIFYFRRFIGTFGSLSAALLMAASPGFVFFSRYFIHEVPFIFFTLALVVAVMRFKETAQPRYLMLASVSAALLFATKETYIITVVVLLLAVLCAHFYMSLRTRFAPKPIEDKPRPKKTIVKPPKQDAAIVPQKPASGQWLTAVALFLLIYVLFYSSFLTNFPKGIYDSIRTFGYWGHTGVSAYKSPWHQYFDWLFRATTELPSMVLGGLGIIVALYQARSRFAVFLAFWALGMTAAYSLVPYKTPWLALSLLLPIIMMAGYFLGQWFDLGARVLSPLLRISAVFALLVAVTISGYAAIDVSFFSYDNDTIPYSYAHTSRDFLGLVDEIESAASHNSAGKNIGMTVMGPVPWPLPWYLRDFSNVGYVNVVVPTSQPIIVAGEDQSQEVERTMGTLYRRFHSYDLRPGVRLALFLRRDVRP